MAKKKHIPVESKTTTSSGKTIRHKIKVKAIPKKPTHMVDVKDKSQKEIKKLRKAAQSTRKPKPIRKIKPIEIKKATPAQIGARAKRFKVTGSKGRI